MQISIRFCRPARRILWPNTCAVWSTSGNRTTSRRIKYFSAIAGAFTAFPYGYYVQGATKFALGQAEAAEGMLGEYLGRVPGDPEATRLIASAALQQHGAARAIDYLKPLADKSRPDAKTLALLGNAYMVDGKPGAGAAAIREGGVDRSRKQGGQNSYRGC